MPVTAALSTKAVVPGFKGPAGIWCYGNRLADAAERFQQNVAPKDVTKTPGSLAAYNAEQSPTPNHIRTWWWATTVGPATVATSILQPHVFPFNSPPIRSRNAFEMKRVRICGYMHWNIPADNCSLVSQGARLLFENR